MYEGIGHLAFRVSDIERSLEFYCGMLGFEKHFELYNDNGSLWIQYLWIAEGQYIELFPSERVEPAKDASYQHLSLTVENADYAYKTLLDKGVTLTEPKRGKCGAIQFWAYDPDGNAVEFMELCPDCMQMQNEAKHKNN